MTEPRAFQIVQALQTALREIRKADGYFHDVAELAVKLDADSNVEDFIGAASSRPFVILEVDRPEINFVERSMQVRITHPFTVHLINDSDSTFDDSMLQEFFRLVADAERAIVANHELGGLVVGIKMIEWEKRDVEGQLVWARINFAAVEHREYGAP